ncbi:MAG: NAD(P)H-dependent oxidoreductase [Chloroflexi bacterium]|nr:NAD(P)H-dependent oxidoreductase [Chloroflexota bacterium]
MKIYIVYDGVSTASRLLAAAVAEGAASVPDAEVLLHTAEEATVENLIAADGIIVGSPNWHGLTAPMKLLMDQTGLAWEQAKLVGKVGGAFTTGWSRAAGQEITLLTLLHPLLAHGMIIVGLPWSARMTRSGSYYGPTTTGRPKPEDLEQGRALGRRVARYARWIGIGKGDEEDAVEGGVFYKEARRHNAQAAGVEVEDDDDDD